MSEKTFAQKVREKYKDSVDIFAVRMGVSKTTINAWENGSIPHVLHSTMLEYAYKYDFDIHVSPPEDYVGLDASGKIEYLMRAYGDRLTTLAQRLRLDYDALYRWKNNNRLTPSADRYLAEAATHIDRFTKF